MRDAAQKHWFDLKECADVTFKEDSVYTRRS